jgi:putative transposase
LHILFRLGTTRSLAEVMRQLKGSSSKWINEELRANLKFAWQAGYSAFSVSRSQVECVKRYIAAQEEHHRTKGFKKEILEILRLHGVEYDERYLWE